MDTESFSLDDRLFNVISALNQAAQRTGPTQSLINTSPTDKFDDSIAIGAADEGISMSYLIQLTSNLPVRE